MSEDGERIKYEDELKPAGLEGFEVWDRTVSAPTHHEVKVAFVSVRVGGVIGMNKAAYRMWGEPDACRVMFDPERRRIAFKPCPYGEKGSFDIRFESNIQIPCKTMFDFYGVEIRQTRRYYDPKIVGGVMIVDL